MSGLNAPSGGSSIFFPSQIVASVMPSGVLLRNWSRAACCSPSGKCHISAVSRPFFTSHSVRGLRIVSYAAKTLGKSARDGACSKHMAKHAESSMH